MKGAGGSDLFSCFFFCCSETELANTSSRGIPLHYSLGKDPSLTHSVPFHLVCDLLDPFSLLSVWCGMILTSKTRAARSSPKAVASRASCLSSSSSSFGLIVGNEVRKSLAFVPLLIKWPRPLLTAVSAGGARPPTDQMEPRLNCLSWRRPAFVLRGPRTLPTERSS